MEEALEEMNEPLRDALARQPPFTRAVAEDTRFVVSRQGRSLAQVHGWELALEALKLAWRSDAFAAQIATRLRFTLLRRSVPVLPTLLHHFAKAWAGVTVSDGVVIEPGFSIAHGQIVLAGLTSIGRGAIIAPFVTVGLVAGDFQGPTIGRNTFIGTGSRVLGPVVVGSNVRIGANSVVLDDLPDGIAAAGAPARPVGKTPPLGD